MTAKKATSSKVSSLDDLLNKEEETPETEESTASVYADGAGNEYDKDGNLIEPTPPPFTVPEDADKNVRFVDPSADHVHTWEEDHDQNLARVQKDVIPALPPSEQPTTTRVVTETVYAKESKEDDTGRKLVDDNDEKNNDTVYDSDESYADYDEDDDDVRKSNEAFPPNAGSSN